MTWDLHHEPPSRATSDVATPLLPQPTETRGPFVAPGTFTVTLTADGSTSSQQIEVRGDPLLPLSDTQWQTRETFLVNLLELQRALRDHSQRAAQLARQLTARRDSLGGNVPPQLDRSVDGARELVQRLRRLSGTANSIAGEFNGRGVRQGSLYPPTNTHLERWRRLEQGVREASAALDQLEQQVRER